MIQNPKSQIEKQIDELRKKVAGAGTGKFLDAGHTSVAHNDTVNNTSQGLYDSVDGYKNTLTGAGSISGDVVSNGCNTVTGQHNAVNASRDCIVNGLQLSVINSRESVFTGYGGTYINAAHSFCAADGGYVMNASASLLIGNIIGGSQGGQSIPSGTIANSAICCSSVTIAYNTATRYSAIFGHGTETTGNLTDSLISGNIHHVSGDEHVLGGSSHDVTGTANTALGCGHKMRSSYATLVGKYGETASSDDVVFGVGWGSSSQRENVFTVDKDGDVLAAGTYGTMGADYAEYFEWLDGNPDNEDRRGMLVNLDGDKIIPAHGNEFIGVISVNPSVIGNSAEMHWHGKYKTDVFGAALKDEAGKPIISDEYKKQKYIPRSERPEWAVVGLVGRLVVTDDGSCKVGSSISARNGIATSCYTGAAKVLRRLDENHIEILLR